MVQWCWVNSQCWGVLRIWIVVGQGPSALAVGAGGGCLDIFSLVYHFSCLSPSLWETARYRLKYCLKGPLSQKTTTTTTINFCSQIFYKFHKLFPYESMESKFDLAIKNVKVNPRSLLEHFRTFLGKNL